MRKAFIVAVFILDISIFLMSSGLHNPSLYQCPLIPHLAHLEMAFCAAIVMGLFLGTDGNVGTGLL
jgi:hypothetical protein